MRKWMRVDSEKPSMVYGVDGGLSIPRIAIVHSLGSESGFRGNIFSSLHATIFERRTYIIFGIQLFTRK